MCFVIVIFVNWTVSQDFRPFFGAKQFLGIFFAQKNIYCYFLYENFLIIAFLYENLQIFTLFLFKFFIFRVINVYFLPKRCKLLLFHNIFLVFCNCKNRIKERKKECMRQMGNERKKPKKKRKYLQFNEGLKNIGRNTEL